MVKFFILFFLFILSVNLVLAEDPTRPPQSIKSKAYVKKPSVKKFIQPLTAIFIYHNKSTAIIENKTYQVGQFYKGNKILKIQSDRVLLQSTKRKFYLTLIPKIKKK